MYHLLLLIASASAAFEDLEVLDERVLAVAPDAAAIDKRLKLAECPDDPIVAPPANGAVIIRCPAVGWRLRVAVNAPANASERVEIIVRKGEMVECVSGGPGFAVSTTMIALEDAGMGKPVRVKSLTSPVPITALVTARGLVSF
jgi:flagellar basal body P-ring formation protein FlgA